MTQTTWTVRTYQLFKCYPILVLPLCNEPIAGRPVIENVVEDQTGAVFLLDTGLLRTDIVEMTHSDSDQRIILRHIQVLFGHSREDEPHIPPYDVGDLLLCVGHWSG